MTVVITDINKLVDELQDERDRLLAEVARLQGERDAARNTIAYYEGKSGGITAYELMAGDNSPKHKFTDEGICIRCGEDAEEWDTGCVEELAKELDEARAEFYKLHTDNVALRKYISEMLDGQEKVS